MAETTEETRDIELEVREDSSVGKPIDLQMPCRITHRRNQSFNDADSAYYDDDEA